MFYFIALKIGLVIFLLALKAVNVFLIADFSATFPFGILRGFRRRKGKKTNAFAAGKQQSGQYAD